MLFKIGQVAKLVGVQTHTIRFWESHFPHILSKNEKTKTRYYDSFCVSEFIKIKNLMQEGGMKISGIVKLVEDGEIQLKRAMKISNNAKKMIKIETIISNTVQVQSMQKEYNKRIKKNILEQTSGLKKVLKGILNKS